MGSQVNPLWLKCGSTVSNSQLPGANRGPMPTELLLGINCFSFTYQSPFVYDIFLKLLAN